MHFQCSCFTVSTEYSYSFKYLIIIIIFCNRGLLFVVVFAVFFVLPCLRQILRDMASLSNTTSHGHKASRKEWNFLSSLHVGLESVEDVLVSPDGPPNSSVASLSLVVGGTRRSNSC